MEYGKIYDAYWSQERVSSHAPDINAEAIADQVLSAFGCGAILDIGSGRGALVRALLQRGADAYGLDVSLVANEYSKRFSSERFVTGSALSLPFPDNSFDTLVSTNLLQHLESADAMAALREMYRVSRRYVFLVIATNSDLPWHRTVHPRAWWEDAAFDAGFRKNPFYYVANPYESLQRDGDRIAIVLEKIPFAALQEHSMAELRRNRALHMDMSRETGARSDAHMARYALAAEWIRPSDTVLDCACGLGYGSAMLASLSKGRHFIAVDLEERAVTYARHNFADSYGIDYRQGNAEDLSFLPDATVDSLVSFETLEHVPDFNLFLKEASRVIKPDGRIIVSVPNRWEDETGKDPNPYHFHVFDYAKTRASLEAHGFTVEARYAQSAPGGFKLVDSPRILEQRPLQAQADEADTEWWIVVASASPLQQSKNPYSHPDFQRSHTGDSHLLTDFAKFYDNPWLYRPMVQMGERLRDTDALRQLCQKIVDTAAPDSADYGAALTVKGYDRLASEAGTHVDDTSLIEAIEKYLQTASANPHVVRWQVSMAFLAGLLMKKQGRREEALRYFKLVIDIDPCIFSPLLATKTVAACFWSGVLHLSANDPVSARNYFSAGVKAARYALHAPDENAIGKADDPLAFGFPELAEVADMASQCANALHYIEEFHRAPGKFWRAINVRRFGLATWAIALQRELDAMTRETELKGASLRDALQVLDQSKSPFTRMINTTLGKMFGLRIVRLRILDQLRKSK